MILIRRKLGIMQSALTLLCTVFGFSDAFLYPQTVAKKPIHALNLFESVEAAIEEAQRICAVDPDSNECRVAWDIVEELEAADSDKGGFVEPEDIGMDTDALLGSFDILTRKIDVKMDQLKATAEQLESMGAPGEMDVLVRLAEEMKIALANSRAAFGG